MTNRFHTCILLLVSITSFLLPATPTRVYNPNNEIEMDLVILSIQPIPLYNIDEFILIRAQDPRSQVLYTLEVAPASFLKETPFQNFYMNDMITVRGAVVDTQENWIMSRMLKKKGSLPVKVRSETGFPLWRVHQFPS